MAFRCPKYLSLLAGALLAATGHAADPAAGEALRNYYNDPFVQVTAAIPACPTPRGPFMTAQESRAEAHPRAERGTTCFMMGKCSEANAYHYDARIAVAAQDAVRRALTRTPALARSSVWLTVQRRFIFVHGCTASRADAARWETLLRAVPEVEYVGVDLAVVPGALNVTHLPPLVHIPYPKMPPSKQ